MFLIETAPDGDFMIRATSINWKEGMEVFETIDECSAEVERRRNAKMESGYCPRCNYKFATETSKDISYLDAITNAKGGTLYECRSCKSLWYKHPSISTSAGYDSSLKEFLLEWTTRDLKPASTLQPVLDKVGNISPKSSHEIYAAAVLLDGKTEYQPALIHLSSLPPAQQEFNKNDWHYLDVVKDIKPSPLAYSHEVGSHIMKMQLSNYEWVYIKSMQTKTVYGFAAGTGVFMPKELEGQDFRVVTSKKEKYEAKNFYIPAERGGPDDWLFTQTTAITILGNIK